MYDIKLLEEEWKKYRKKKRKPWFVFLFSVFFLFLVSVGLLNYKESDFFQYKFTLNDNNRSKTVIKTSTVLLPLLDKALTTLETKKAETAEPEPVTVISHENGSDEIIEDMPIEEDATITEDQSEIIEENRERPHKKIHLDIIETTSVSAYKDVAKRFHESHDTDDSLFLAKSYYNRRNYKKAEYWALQTNKVNGNIEESWLIFAKAKVKLGRRNEAMRILKAYIRKSNSEQAERLLHKIKAGSFK